MISKLLLRSVILLVSIFLFSVNIVYSFEDNFANSTSLDNYTIYPNGGSVSIQNGEMVISPGSPNTYPYVILKPTLYTLPISDAEVSFRYGTVTGFGAGVVFDNKIPQNGEQPNVAASSIAWTWNQGNPPVLNYGVSLLDYSPISSNLTSHILSVKSADIGYAITLDNISTKMSSKTNLSNIWFGNPEVTLTGDVNNWPTIHIQNVRVNEKDTLPPSSTFPYFSQLDPKWKDEVYDSADKWAGLGKNGIGRWGCALTSAAMVLQKNGVKALDGSDLDPSKLNTWLKSQPDGYLGLGYLNWLALTRYARLSHEAGHSPTKLEFTRSGTPTFPSIIGLPGHFVVVHGEDGSNWLVNDPANKTITTLPKSTALSSVNTFMPSMTDLSYMLFSSTPAITTSMIKEHGKNLNIDWKNEQVSDVVDNSAGPTNRIGLVSKPETGEYELKVSNTSDKPANFDIYLYDKFGNPFVKKLLIGKHSSIKFEIKYNKDKLGKIKIENVKKYRYEWNSKKRWYEKIWDEHDRWEERKSD